MPGSAAGRVRRGAGSHRRPDHRSSRETPGRRGRDRSRRFGATSVRACRRLTGGLNGLQALRGIQIGPDDLQVAVTKQQVKTAPDIEMHGEELSQNDESTLYHHFELNYAPPDTHSGRRPRPPLGFRWQREISATICSGGAAQVSVRAAGDCMMSARSQGEAAEPVGLPCRCPAASAPSSKRLDRRRNRPQASPSGQAAAAGISGLAGLGRFWFAAARPRPLPEPQHARAAVRWHHR